jgi:hypothetical protein
MEDLLSKHWREKNNYPRSFSDRFPQPKEEQIDALLSVSLSSMIPLQRTSDSIVY